MTSHPGRDPRAVLHAAPAGHDRVRGDRRVVVVGGGVAGLAAAAVLAEHGVHVVLLEAGPRLGGRVAAWPVAEDRTMSRGFHAFFRQYYNLRSLLARVDADLGMLTPLGDYPIRRPDGLTDSFADLPTTPPWSILGFVRRSPSFTLRGLAGVNVPAALELLRTRFPYTYGRYDGVSAAQFLDRLRFPQAARHLALEVFARSFFADPRDFSAGELVAMFHTYFLGSAEGLIFDVPTDDYDTSLWAPLGRRLHELGVDVRTASTVTGLRSGPAGVELNGGETVTADAVVLATDPRVARQLIAGLRTGDGDGDGDGLPAHEHGVEPDGTAAVREWQRRVAATRNAPPFVVLRLWLDGIVRADRTAFLGTTGYGPLDNVSVLERFEHGAAQWSAAHGGSVVELHAYACDPEVMTEGSEPVAAELVEQLHRVYPETASMGAVHRELLVADDCTLIGPQRWEERPGVATPVDDLVLAGDWVRCDYPVALMERAATTGYLAANRLLEGWGSGGQDIWTVPMEGVLVYRRRGRRSDSGTSPVRRA